MSQERLVGLATISIEKDMAYQLKIKDLLKNFSKIKARKVPLAFLILALGAKIPTTALILPKTKKYLLYNYISLSFKKYSFLLIGKPFV